MMNAKETEDIDWTVNPFADPSVQNVTNRSTEPLLVCALLLLLPLIFAMYL